MGTETLTIWSTNEKLNTEAFLAAAQGKFVSFALQLVDGVDCDGQWTWHVDPQDIALDADYDASCDALPSVVQASKATWLATKKYCPSNVLISSFGGTP